jgi:site-specific DNA-adenine methylase
MKHECLKPFFCYYGGKWRAAKHYPEPRHDILVEPFAGGAGYSLRHYDKKVRLFDADPIITGVWDYIIKSSADEILNLPNEVDHIDNLNVCQEAKWLIGFWLNKGSSEPYKRPSKWMKEGKAPNSWWGDGVKRRIVDQQPFVRHWEITNLDYRNIPNLEAMWFVDPPYDNKAGKRYRKQIPDYVELANWCRSRQGNVVVCEQEGANWLPFEPFMQMKSTPSLKRNLASSEVIWKNF